MTIFKRALTFMAVALLLFCPSAAREAYSEGDEDELSYWEAWDSRYADGAQMGDYMGTWTVGFCDEWAPMNSRPDESSELVVKIPRWADVEAYYYDISWYECEYNGMRGYILRDYLTDRPGKFPDYPGNSDTGEDGGEIDEEYPPEYEQAVPVELENPPSDDAESALRQKLLSASGRRDAIFLGCADYDGDGETEAFGLMGQLQLEDGDISYQQDAELWFACAEYAVQCETEGGCYPDECAVYPQDGGYVFKIVEGYSGSGSQARLWTVRDHRPTRITGGYMTARDISETSPVHMSERWSEAPSGQGPEGGAQDAREAFSDEYTVGLFIENEPDEYGDEKMMLGLYDGSGALLASDMIIQWSNGFLEWGGEAGATLWKLDDDLYYVEAFIGADLLSARYMIYKAEGASLSLLAGAEDLGGTESTYLEDMRTGEPLLYDEQLITPENEETPEKLNEHFSEYGMRFSYRVVFPEKYYGLSGYISARLSDSMIVDEIIYPQESGGSGGTEGGSSVGTGEVAEEY